MACLQRSPGCVGDDAQPGMTPVGTGSPQEVFWGGVGEGRLAASLQVFQEEKSASPPKLPLFRNCYCFQMRTKFFSALLREKFPQRMFLFQAEREMWSVRDV